MSKGTILYVGGFELPDKNAAAHRVLSNGKIFRELGYKVVFIDVDKTLPYDSDILTTNKDVQGFECWSIPYPNSKIEWFKYLTKIDFMNVMTKKYSDINVVVAYNYPALALRNLNKYCLNKNIKIIGDCTEWYSTKGTSIVFKIIKGLDSFYRMKIVQKQLDGIIVISEYLEKYYGVSKNIVRIPPLVDIDESKWKVSRLKSSNDKLRLIYSGSPGKNKDKINKLIESLYFLREFENYEMKVVGITKEEYFQYYPQDRDKIRGLGERVIFMGRLSHHESIQQLKNSDFSIFIRENNRLTKAGFPTKFVESISCGIPVITTNTSDLNQYLIDGFNGFYIHEDVNKSIDKIREILSLSRNEVDNIKGNCVNSVNFNYDNYFDVCQKFIDGVIKNRISGSV